MTEKRNKSELLAGDWRSWTLAEVVALLKELRDDPALGPDGSYAVNHAYVELRDHWQDGKQWVGPVGSNTEQKVAILEAVKRQFTPDEALNEAIERRTKGVLKVPPQIQIVDPNRDEDEDGEDKRPDDVKKAEAALIAWCKSVGLKRRAEQAFVHSAWSSRGSLRVMALPSALTTIEDPEDGTTASALRKDVRDIAEALEHVGLDAPLPEWAAVVEMDDHTKVGVVLFEERPKEGEVKHTADLWRFEEVTGDSDEVTQGTVLRQLEGAAGNDDSFEAHEFGPYDLGGLLPVAEMSATPIVTESVRAMQRRLNYAQTLLNRCMEASGFVERYTINASDEGDWLHYAPSGPTVPRTAIGPGGKTLYFHPRPRTFGSGSTTELRGIDVGIDENGKKVFTSPSVVFREPTDPEYVIKSIEASRASLLQRMKQGHLASTSRVELSGNAYEQARNDYVEDLTDGAAAMTEIIKTALTVALRYAIELSGAELPEGYEVQVILTVRPGPVSPDLKRANAEMVKGALLSRSTAIQMNGSDDPEAELEAIRAEEDESIERLVKRAELADKLTAAGAPIREAALVAGFTEEHAKLLGAVPQGVEQ